MSLPNGLKSSPTHQEQEQQQHQQKQQGLVRSSVSRESVLSIFSIGAPGLSVKEITLVSEEGRTGLLAHSVAEDRRFNGEIKPLCLEKIAADWSELAAVIRPPVDEEGEPLPPGRQDVIEGGTPTPP